MVKYGTAIGHRWQYGTAHAHCTLNNKGYKHKLRICNTYCFYTAIKLTVMRLDVTLYVHCMSCSCGIMRVPYSAEENPGPNSPSDGYSKDVSWLRVSRNALSSTNRLSIDILRGCNAATMQAMRRALIIAALIFNDRRTERSLPALALTFHIWRCIYKRDSQMSRCRLFRRLQVALLRTPSSLQLCF